MHVSLYMFDNKFENHPTPWPQGAHFFSEKYPKQYFRKTMVLTLAMERTSNADKNT